MVLRREKSDGFALVLGEETGLLSGVLVFDVIGA